MAFVLSAFRSEAYDNWQRQVPGFVYVRKVFGLVVLLVGCAALFSPVASAESLCTDSWVGPAEGEWSETASWSAGWVPTSTDVACIGAGKTVKVTGGVGAVTGVVQGAGTLEVQASSLEIASSLEPSVISSFTQTGGTLTGAGSLQVSSSLSWTRGTMAGSGQTVVKAGAVAILSSGENKFLATRTLTNDGTMTLSEGQFWMSSGADLDNVGTVIANSEYGIPVVRGKRRSSTRVPSKRRVGRARPKSNRASKTVGP